MATKLEVRNVCKSFHHRGEELQVLQDFSLRVEGLEFLVLLGPSGCGKSTLLRIVDGIDDRSEEHTSELQSLMRLPYAVFCLNKNTITSCSVTILLFLNFNVKSILTP